MELKYSKYDHLKRTSGFIVKEGRIREKIYDFEEALRILELVGPPPVPEPMVFYDWEWDREIRIGIIEFEPHDIVHKSYSEYGV